MTDSTQPIVQLSAMQQAANEAVLLLKKLANTDRLMLLCKLAEREMNVSELEEELQIFQPTLSQQLGILRRDGLVDSRREGKQIYYRMTNTQVMAVIQVLYQLYCVPKQAGQSEQSGS